MSGGLVMLAAPAATADGPEGPPPGNLTKTGICHRTASDSNPYVFEEVDDESLDAHYHNLAGHPAKYWKSDGTWRGVEHSEGDAKNDYQAASSADCNDSSQTYDECKDLPGFQEEGFDCTKEPTTREVERSDKGCLVQGPEGAVGGEWTWTDVYTTTYTFDAVEQEWVGTEGDAVAGPKTWEPFTAQERIRYECDTTTQDACPQLGGIQPAGFQCTKGPDTSTVPKRAEGCDVQGPNGLVGGVQTWNEVTTTTYSFNEQTQQWVGSTTGPVTQDQQFVPYTADQRLANGCDEVLAVQKIAPRVSFADPTCERLNRAKWSGNLTDLVDYTVSGTPGRGNSVTVTANIKPAVADQFAFADGFVNTFDHSYPSKADLKCATVKGSESSRPKPHTTRTPTVLGTQAVAPTAVDAGLASLPGDSATSTASLLAQLMVAGGLLLLLAGGWLGLGRRENGAHQA